MSLHLCAFGKCDRVTCWCAEFKRRFPAVQPCLTDWCRFVNGHRGSCLPREKKKKELEGLLGGTAKAERDDERLGVAVGVECED